MDARYYNGEPDAQHDPGRSHNRPLPYICLHCGEVLTGQTGIMRHTAETGHRGVVLRPTGGRDDD